MKYLNKIKQLVVIIPLVVAVAAITGLYFANKQSEPEFASKVDKIMFDTKNKSPKYVISLPEENEIIAKKAKIERDKIKKKELLEQKKPKTNIDKLNKLEIPFLSRLPARETTIPQQVVLPDESFLQKNDEGVLLPVKNGSLKPWEYYGKKVSVLPMFSRVAVVIRNMGINSSNSDLIINRMPENVSLSFSPYASSLSDSIKKARENGHETYFDMLLPTDYVREDVGPKAISWKNSSENNQRILENILAINAVSGGFIVRDGLSADKQFAPLMTDIMKMLESRGLVLVDSTTNDNIEQLNAEGLDRVKADIVIDKESGKEAVLEMLQQAEQLALQNGSVVIVMDPKPIAVLMVAQWLKSFSPQLTYEEMKTQNITGFERPFALVPLSNLIIEY